MDALTPTLRLGVAALVDLAHHPPGPPPSLAGVNLSERGRLAAGHVDEHASKRNRSWKRAVHHIQKYVLPRWGHLAAGSITRSQVCELHSSIAAPILANHVKAAVSAVFTWAIGQDVLTDNPCRGVANNPTTSRERVPSDEELRILWREADAHGLLVSTALKVLLLVGQRPGEVRRMRREHINNNFWEMPGERIEQLRWPGTKNKKSHRVWLPAAARELIAEVNGHDLTAGPIFNGTVNLDKAMRAISAHLNDPPVRPHDLRRAHGTAITRLGFGRDALNRIQNHREGGIADVYDRHDYGEKDKAIMEAVAAHILAVARACPTTEVNVSHEKHLENLKIGGRKR